MSDDELIAAMWLEWSKHATPKPFDVHAAMRAVLAVVRKHDEGRAASPVAWMVINADGAISLFSDYDEACSYADWAHGPRPVHQLFRRSEEG